MEYSESEPQDVLRIIRAESDAATALAAKKIGFDLQSSPPLKAVAKRCDDHLADMVGGLLKMLSEEEDLLLLDEYTFLLTGLRYATGSKRAANLMILEATVPLIRPFRIGYEQKPDGYTGPELISMWSSILNEEGSAQCSPYMGCLVPEVSPCVNSSTVGSVVAALLIANLVGHLDDLAGMFDAAIPLMIQALQAAFTGFEYAERKWGPGPVAKSFASLSVAGSNRQKVFDLQLLPRFTRIIEMADREWSVEGFDAEYYMGAKASACKVLWNVAKGHDVEAQCPDVLTILRGFLASKGLSALARANAECAEHQVVLFRGAGATTTA